MTKDDLRDGLALVGASLTGDAEGSRVIREHADNEGLIDALVTACNHAVRLLAKHDGATPERAVEQMQKVLRTL